MPLLKMVRVEGFRAKRAMLRSFGGREIDVKISKMASLFKKSKAFLKSVWRIKGFWLPLARALYQLEMSSIQSSMNLPSSRAL